MSMIPPEFTKAAADGLGQQIKSFDKVQLLIAVLLTFILGGGGYGFIWAVKETKSGVKELNEANAAAQEKARQDCATARAAADAAAKEEREQTRAHFLGELREARATFERTLDRFQGVKRAASQPAGESDHRAEGAGGPPSLRERLEE